MHSCNPSDSLSAQDVFWVAASHTENPASTSAADPAEYSITDLSRDFGVTHRALRFYESRGLLSPQRDGRRRIYSRGDRDRLALILQGKKLGFTITEIGQMVEAQSGRASGQMLKFTAEKCLEQIAFFERQMREAGEALAELRRIHLLLCRQSGQQGDKAKG